MKKRSEEKQPSIKFLRKRKFLLVLPVIVLPFLLLLVWTLGIAGEAKATGDKETAFRGLNLDLPNAAPSKDSNWNKLKYYEQADKDSLKLRSLLKNDPYRQVELSFEKDTALSFSASKNERSVFNPYPGTQTTDANEQRVYQKLAALNQELESAAQKDREPRPNRDTFRQKIDIPSTDVDRLESMMKSVNGNKEEDPEIGQLNQMLEKIMDIQHPERVQEKIREQSQQNKRQVYSVETPKDDVVSVLEAKQDFSELLTRYKTDSMPAGLQELMQANRFYGLDDGAATDGNQLAVAAVVHEDQTLVSGATVKLRLLQDIFISGVRIPKDQFVFGLATLNGERLQVLITSITYQNHILPVSLSVYDRDGIAGINIPGAITRDVAKRSAAQSAQGIGSLNTLNTSLEGQAVSAGLTMAQNLVGKSAKLVRVNLKAGYHVLLKDDNSQDK